MALTTTVGKTHDGRWQMVTRAAEGSPKFVSSAQLPDDMLGFDRAMGFGGKPYETILHDESGWVETPDGQNAVQYDTQEACEADHRRIVAEFFGPTPQASSYWLH